MACFADCAATERNRLEKVAAVEVVIHRSLSSTTIIKAVPRSTALQADSGACVLMRYAKTTTHFSAQPVDDICQPLTIPVSFGQINRILDRLLAGDHDRAR